jgi:hypothetical protein
MTLVEVGTELFRHFNQASNIILYMRLKRDFIFIKK